MKRSTAWCALFIVAGIVVGTAAGADRVTFVRQGKRRVIKVQAGPAGRNPLPGGGADRRAIYDFHLMLPNGKVVSHGSPQGWASNHQAGNVGWATQEAPIRFNRSLDGFSLRYTGTGQAQWITTDKNGAPIAQGTINLN